MGNEWPNAIASHPSSVLPRAEMLWLEDKLRPVEPSVKGKPKKCEVIRRAEHKNEVKYSHFHRVRSAEAQPLFRRLLTASPLLYRRISTRESAGFPRLFRIFCPSDYGRIFPQRLRRHCAGISGLDCKEKWRKGSEFCVLRKKPGPRVAVRVPRAFSAVARGTVLPAVEILTPTIFRGSLGARRLIMKKNRKIELMLQEIRSRGGIVGISDKLPDEALEFFLQEILDCPDCIKEAQRAARVPPSRHTDH